MRIGWSGMRHVTRMAGRGGEVVMASDVLQQLKWQNQRCIAKDVSHGRSLQLP